MATIGCYKLPEFINAQKMLLVIMKEPAGAKPAELIGTIINLANVSRKEGLLALDEATTDIEDPFLRKGVMLVVDGTDPDLVRAILETEMNAIEDRHKKLKKCLKMNSINLRKDMPPAGAFMSVQLYLLQPSV